MERSRRAGLLSFRPARIEDAVTVSMGRFEWPAPDVLNEQARVLRETAVTFKVDAEPAALLGMVPVWPGVAAGWAFVDRSYFERNFSRTRALVELSKALLGWYQQENALHRIEIKVERHDTGALEFARTLGFTDEGVLRKGNQHGDDLIIMGMVWE